jgi:N-methylhydantoinase B
MIDASGGVLDQDYEMFEQQTPHLLLEHEYLENSAGAGQWRGGLGVKTRFEIGGENTKVVTFGDGDVEPAFGLFGGKEGTLNKIELHFPDGKTYKTTSKDLIENVPAGTILYQLAGGGGGYGDPYLRDTALTVKEVRNGIISVNKAREDYGVVVNPENFELDLDTTKKIRGKGDG